MAKYIQIGVDNPCHQKWEDMQVRAAGSFCNSCQKTVIDFTGMTDSQLMEYLKKHGDGVCGRFYPDQLDKKIEIPVKKIPWLKYFFQITLPAMLFSYRAHAQRLIKKNIAPVVLIEKKKMPPAIRGAIAVTGRITGYNGQPVAGASVVISGTNKGIVADSNGIFALRLMDTERDLEVTAVGYEKKQVTITDREIDIRLDVMTNESIQLTTVTVRSSKTVMGASRHFESSYWLRKNKKDTILHDLLATANTISLFPNPANRASLVTIRWKKTVSNDQQIILYNASGMKMLAKTITIKQPVLQAQLQLDVIAAGYYIINVVDGRTGEKQVAKLIVE